MLITPHTLIYGESGTGKSSLARTWPKPILVLSFDPRSKEVPYLSLGNVKEDTDGNVEVYSKTTGKLLVRVEYFHDPADEKDMRKHNARDRFRARLKQLPAEFNNPWQTVVFDSLSFMEVVFRKYDEYVVNVGAKDRRQYYGASTGELEELIMWKTSGWPVHLVVIAHTDYDKAVGDSGVLRYKPKTPGQKQLRDIGAAFSEMYHTYVKEDENGEAQYLVQTRTTGLFPAASRVGAPNPCEPHFKALFSNFKAPTPVEAEHEGTGSILAQGVDSTPTAGDGDRA